MWDLAWYENFALSTCSSCQDSVHSLIFVTISMGKDWLQSQADQQEGHSPLLSPHRQSLATQTFAAQPGQRAPSQLYPTLSIHSGSDPAQTKPNWHRELFTALPNNWHYNNYYNVMGKSWCFTWAELVNSEFLTYIWSKNCPPWATACDIVLEQENTPAGIPALLFVEQTNAEMIPNLCCADICPFWPQFEWFGKLWNNWSVTVCTLLKITSTF